MITLETSGRFYTGRTYRAISRGTVALTTDVILECGDLVPILQSDKNLKFHTNHSLRNRRISPVVLQELLKNSDCNILIHYKNNDFIVGKNLICTYNKNTGDIKVMMVHFIDPHAKSLRVGKVVINPELLAIDPSFKKIFEAILRSNVDIEVTKFIEEKYYKKASIPKFKSIRDSLNFISDFTDYMSEHINN